MPRYLLIAMAMLLHTLCAVIGHCADAKPAAPRHLDRSEAAPSLTLTRDGQALLDIIIPPNTTEELRQTAADLADYLQKVTGATFATRAATTGTGIFLGKATDFPELKLTETLPVNGPEDWEHYLVRTQPGRLLLIGTTDLAADHAAYHFLERIGCRWFFPTRTWEELPSMKTLQVKLDLNERPDYIMRSVWGRGMFGGDTGERWTHQNRMKSPITINAGHAYDSIINRYKTEFKNHPEYFALIGGERKLNGQFCVSNPGLRQLVVKHALEVFKTKPAQMSLSLEPRDNTLWCECQDCLKLGGPTDRVILLANLVAEEVDKVYPNKFVGLYAYSNHATPPTIEVHPHVYPLLATAYTGGYGIDGLIQGWGPKVTHMGVREYFSVYIGDWALPASARASSPKYMAEQIPYFYRNRINALSAESSDSWGAQGLGYYMAMRLLWNVDTDVKATLDDFFARAFKKAAPVMRVFYDLNDSSNKPLRGDDHMARLFRCLAKARELEQDPNVTARLDDLTLWLTYADLYTTYDGIVKNPEKTRAAAEEVVRFVWKIRDTHMVSISVWGNLRGAELLGTGRRRGAPPPPNLTDEEMKAYQQSLQPTGTFTHEDIVKMNRDGVAKHTLVEYDKPNYGNGLVPSGLPAVQERSPVVFSLTNTLYLMAGKDGTLPTIYVTSGKSRVALETEYNEATWKLIGADGTVIEQGTLPTETTDYVIPITTKQVGVYQLTLRAARSPITVRWDAGAQVCFSASREQGFNSHINRNPSFYFYVPKGTKQVVLYGKSMNISSFFDGANKLVYTHKNVISDHIVIPVKLGQDGQAWRALNLNGHDVMLLSVPPYLAVSPDELLIPRETKQP